MYIEINNKIIKDYGKENAIKNGFFMVWTQERIRRAFNNGNGTMKDFIRFRNDNKKFCTFMQISKPDLLALYPDLRIEY